MSPPLLTVKELLGLLGLIFTTATAVWKGRWLLCKMRRGWLYLTGVNTLTGDLRELRGQLDRACQLQESLLTEVREIRGELRPNGGSSLHDAVHAIAAAVKARDDRDGDPLFWTDERGRLTHVNRAYLQASGRSREELVGSGWVNFVHPTDRDRVLETWRSAVAEARDFDDVFRVLGTGGELRTVHCVATRLLHSTTGRLLGYYGQLRSEVPGFVSSRANP